MAEEQDGYIEACPLRGAWIKKKEGIMKVGLPLGVCLGREIPWT
jgi:hypothetical protein